MTKHGAMVCEPRLLKVIHAADTMPIRYLKDVDMPLPASVVSSLPSWRQDPLLFQNSAATLADSSTVEHSLSVINLAYIHEYCDAQFGNHLFVGLQTRFIIVNSDNFDTVFEFDFLHSKISSELLDGDEADGSVIESASMYRFGAVKGSSNCMAILAANALSGDISVIQVHLKRKDTSKINTNQYNGITGDMSLLEMVSNLVAHNLKGEKWIQNTIIDSITQLEAAGIYVMADIATFGLDRLPQNLPFYIRKYFEHVSSLDIQDEAFLSTLSFTESSDKVNPGSILAKPEKAKSNTIVSGMKRLDLKNSMPGRTGHRDEPVTFRKSVRSSGYSSAPAVTKMFTRTGSKVKTPTRAAQSTAGPIGAVVSYDRLTSRRAMAHPPHRSTVTSVKYNSTGTYLASCSADRIARFCRVSAKPTCRDFAGHDAAVTSLAWSLSPVKSYGHLLLTSCRDGKARMWSTEKSDALLEFSGISTKTSKQKYTSAIKNACFYYCDRFVIVPHQSSIYIYEYKLESVLLGSVKPQLNYNTYKLVKTFTQTAQTITSSCCVNTQKSHLILAGMSDKCVRIWDVNTGKQCRIIENAHTRATNDIHIPDYGREGHMFATSAVGDSVKVWDVRQRASAMHLHGHTNRQVLLNTCISPCGDYLAVGSEDQHCYVYDLRMKLVAYKTGGNHGDAVTAVGFSPVASGLVTGCADGQVRLFGKASK